MTSDLLQLRSFVYLSGKMKEPVVCVFRGILEGDAAERHSINCPAIPGRLFRPLCLSESITATYSKDMALLPRVQGKVHPRRSSQHGLTHVLRLTTT